MDFQRIAIGTAQLGADYGIAFKSKKMSSQEFKLIMDSAKNANINSIDTAIAYGDAQNVLGQIGVTDWSITTKLPPVPNKITTIETWYNEAVETSLKELKISKIDTLLVHDVNELSGQSSNALINLLHRSKSNGVVNKIGVSIYSPTDLDKFYKSFKPDIVQCPYNIFDQRIYTSGWLEKLTSEGVEIHARSVFLQGLILRKVTELHPYFEPWYSKFHNWEKFCRKLDISKLQAALDFVKNEKRISKIIIGIESNDQLQQVLKAYGIDNKEIFLNPCEDLALVNPLMWKII
ncbi:aldo/keto reductase [Planktomarina temperata]|nr:aldo/keto reductase [Planktomarina temperata]